MGASGQIKIYNIRSFQVKYGKHEAQRFLDFITDSLCHRRQLNIKDYASCPVLTVYFGYDTPDSSLFERIAYDQLDKIDIDAALKQGYTVDALKDIVCYLQDECEIGKWEIWT